MILKLVDHTFKITMHERICLILKFISLKSVVYLKLLFEIKSIPWLVRGFLRNSRKYGLGSLRKTPLEGTSLIGPGPITIGLKPYNPGLTHFLLSKLLIICRIIIINYLSKKMYNIYLPLIHNPPYWEIGGETIFMAKDSLRNTSNAVVASQYKCNMY